MMKFPLRKKNPNQETKRGRFIVIDGSDGTGKATQTRLLLETLRLSGYEAEEIAFPQYQQKSAGPVEEYLSGKYGQLNPYAASIFYAIDRFDAKKKIEAWLNEGKVVVCNRYVTSNAGHQGGKIADENERVKYFTWLHKLEYKIFGISKPDLNIILHIPSDLATKLLKQRALGNLERKLDMHEMDPEHLRNSESTYLQIAKLFPNTKLIDCISGGKLLTPQEVHNKVWEMARRVALKDFEQKK